MIKHHLHIAGVEVDLSAPVSDIEKTINDKLDFFYQGLVTADYQELDERSCQVVFSRNLPFEYHSALNGCLCYIDESIISGLSESSFVFNPGSSNEEPIIAPLLPWGNCWFSPTPAFISLWKRQNEVLINEIISRVKITTTCSDIIVVVRFPRKKGKYDDDVADLEAELGDSLGNLRGQALTFSLSDIGQICQRPYIKKKSYMGLIGYLKKTYDIELVIN